MISIKNISLITSNVTLCKQFQFDYNDNVKCLITINVLVYTHNERIKSCFTLRHHNKHLLYNILKRLILLFSSIATVNTGFYHFLL